LVMSSLTAACVAMWAMCAGGQEAAAAVRAGAAQQSGYAHSQVSRPLCGEWLATGLRAPLGGYMAQPNFLYDAATCL
jgi:hypothetical protein